MKQEQIFSSDSGDSPNLLFVYGTLQPKFGLIRASSEVWSDSIYGDLYDLGDYPGAVNIGRSSTLIKGQILEVSAEELLKIDCYEGVYEGLYRRLKTRSESGATVWVYEFAMNIPESARTIDQWPMSPEDFRPLDNFF